MRIGLVLALVVGLGAVAHASQPYCPMVEAKPGTQIDKTGTRPMPQITSLVLSTADGTDMISMAGTFEPDVTRIQIVTSGGYSLETTPKQLHICMTPRVLGETEHVTIVAYDNAGHASEPFESDVNVSVPAEHPVYQEHHRDHHGMEILITIGAIVLAGMELVGLVLIGFARKKAPFSVAGEFLSPILAENVARGVARSYLIKFSVALAIVLALLGLHHPNIAILVAPFAVVWLFELFLTRLVIGQFDSKIQRLEKRELWIYINSSKLWAPYKIWEKASALPSAGLAKRD
jgi:hypothetical protein